VSLGPSRLRYCRLTSLAASVLLATSVLEAQTRRALIVGINTYHYGGDIATSMRGHLPAELLVSRTVANRRGDMPDLDGAVNDARTMAEVLHSKYQFTAVDTLYNQQATRDGIQSAIRRLIGASKAGDVVVFYYAGHGSQRYNSLAPASVSANRLDQTIVPADANLGQLDLRNAELTQWFDELLAKDVQLTLIFDSCNSGSAVRGLAPPKARFAPYDPRDAHDASDPESVTKPGRHNPALFLAAAQENQSAFEEPGADHGAFTAALLNVMRSSSTPVNAPVQQLFRQVEAALRWSSVPQVPVLKGTGSDPSRPLFGKYSGPAASYTVLSLQGVRGASADTAILDGGAALGIGPGTEVRFLGDSAHPIRLRVVSSDLGTSRAVAIAGKLAPTPGAAYAVDKWVLPSAARMRVWIPRPLSVQQLSVVAAALGELRKGTSADWVADPTALPDDNRPLYTVLYDAGGWKLRTPANKLVALKAASATEVAGAIDLDQRHAADSIAAEATKRRAAGLSAPAPLGRARVFVMLPPSDSLMKSLAADSASPFDIQPSARVDSTRYALVGRIDSTGLSYAWVLPNATPQAVRRSPFPVRTTWFAASDVASAADQLDEWGKRLARVSYWESVQPHSANPFPYHLVMRRAGSEKRIDKTAGDTTPNLGGEQYQFVLRKDSTHQGPVEPQWVYIFTLDRTGLGTLLYGKSLNQMPVNDSTGRRPAPDEIPIPIAPISICPTYGTDTFAMVASARDIGSPEATFNFPAIVIDRGARGATAGEGADPNPDDWSIERIWLRSDPPPASAESLIAQGTKACRVTREQLLDPGYR
jgi:hypothetical protein